MLSRIASPFILALLAFVALLAVIAPVTAMPTHGSSPSVGDVQCNTGPIQCCNSVQSASDPTANLLLGLLGVVVGDINVPIGITCSPISLIGVLSGNDCTAQPVCCENNNFAGLVAIGCSAINI